MLNTVDCLTCTDTVGIVGEGQSVGTVGSGCKLSAFRPCEGIAVVVIQRVADGIIGDSCALIRSQQIAPVGVTVGIIIGAKDSSSVAEIRQRKPSSTKRGSRSMQSI